MNGRIERENDGGASLADWKDEHHREPLNLSSKMNGFAAMMLMLWFVSMLIRGDETQLWEIVVVLVGCFVVARTRKP